MAWKGTRKEFINEFGAYVHKVTSGTGILPGTLIAQLFLESSSKGVVGASKLSQEANNYFGIKCAGGWDGPKYYTKTREFVKGRYILVDACFRSYGSIKDSIQDYVLFLQENPRYKNAGVFQAKTVKEQAQALKRAGYATEDSYAQLIYDVYKPYAQLIEDQKTLKASFSIKKTLGVVLLASAATIIYNKLLKK